MTVSSEASEVGVCVIGTGIVKVSVFSCSCKQVNTITLLLCLPLIKSTAISMAKILNLVASFLYIYFQGGLSGVLCNAFLGTIASHLMQPPCQVIRH